MGLIRELVGPVKENIRRLKDIPSLAISFGSIIKAFAEGRIGESDLADPRYFLRITELTKQYVELLTQILSAFNDRSELYTHLNVEMGSGKTHFLTLLLHIFYSVPRLWDILVHDPITSRFISELEKLGYGRDLAVNVLVIPAEMIATRYREVIDFVCKSLEIVGESSLADKLRKESRRLTPLALGEMLAEELNKRIHTLILIDELYAAAKEKEVRQDAKQILLFVKGFVNRRRVEIEPAKSSGLVLLVSSAREDLEQWMRRRSEIADRELVSMIEDFEMRLRRVQFPIVGSWVMPEEVFKILRRRLFLNPEVPRTQLDSFVRKYRDIIEAIFGSDAEEFLRKLEVTYPFSPSFLDIVDKFLAPQSKSDIPNAQHLRGLIKLCSFLSWNAYNDDSDIISPANLNERGIAIFTIHKPMWEDSVGDAFKYLNIVIEDEHDRRFAYYLIWSIFARSVTEREDRLLKIAMIHKARPQDLQVIRDLIANRFYIVSSIVGLPGIDIRRLDDILEIIEDYSGVVHRVDLKDISGYILITLENPKSIYYRWLDEEKRKWNEEEYIKVVQRVGSIIENSIFEQEIISKNTIQIELMDPNLEVLRDKIRRADNSKLRILILKTWKVKAKDEQEFEKIIDELLRSINKLYDEAAQYNSTVFLIVVLIPNLDDRDIREFMRAWVVFEITKQFIELYNRDVRSIIKRTRTISDEWIRFYESMKITVMNDLLNNVSKYVEAFSRAAWNIIFGYLIYWDKKNNQICIEEYRPRATASTRIDSSLKKVRDPTSATKKIDQMLSIAVRPLITGIIEKIANKLMFTTDAKVLVPELERHIKEWFKEDPERQNLEISPAVPYIDYSGIITTAKVFSSAIRALASKSRIKLSDTEYLELTLRDNTLYIARKSVSYPPAPKPVRRRKEKPEIVISRPPSVETERETPIKLEWNTMSEILELIRMGEIFGKNIILKVETDTLTITIQGVIQRDDMLIRNIITTLLNNSRKASLKVVQ